ncbi:IS256 family transposase [Cyanobium sp. LEGE 06143]|uniref:IS256 family transposase n=1 Tax=Cyanobium sp. LEGE 06143 TaxID=945727 RepID=UPI0021040C32|nr:IS256 family transposase [Cyanobium sp. LEGE 06143]
MTLTHSGASELSQLMEGTTSGALIPEIVRRGFQDLLEAEVSAAIGATRHERCPDERTTHRNGYRQRLLTTQVGDLTLAIPKLRQGSFFPDWLEPRRRVDKALYAVVMEAYTGGISTRKVDALVEALGAASGISKSEVSRICQGLDEQVKAFLGRPLDHARFPYVYLDATYLHGRLGRNMQVVSRAVVVAIGINALGYREVLGIAVGDSEAEGFWRQFLGSLKERGLDGTGLVISDAHLGLTAAIKRMFQGSSWQRCRVHFLRNLLSHVPKAGQDMVAAAMKAVFVIQAPDQVSAHWQRVTEMLRKQFPTAVPVMDAARVDVLAFLHFPQGHWRKIWSTNPLERLNKEIKRRTNVVGIFPNDAAITRLVGSQLLEQQEEWQLERRRFFSEATMAKIPEPKRFWSSAMVNALRRWLEPSPEPNQLLPSI